MTAFTTLPVALAPTAAMAGQTIRDTGTGQADDPGFRARLDRAWQYAKLGGLILGAQVPPQWFSEGDRFVYWATVGPNAGTWVIVDAKTGRQEPVLAAADLKARLSALSNDTDSPGASYQLKPKENRIVFNHGGKILALDLASRRIAEATDKGAWRTPLLSPDGQRSLQFGGGNFRLVDAAGRTVTELRKEEGYNWDFQPTSWSPDNRHLLLMRNDRRKIHKIPIVNYRPLETVGTSDYPKSGTPIPRIEFHMVDTTTGEVKRLPDAEGEGYAWIAGWRPDGSEALVVYLTRDGKRLDLIGFNPVTAASRVIVREERPESFVGALDFTIDGWQRQVKPLEGNRGFLWMSERDGWRHVYHYDWSGKLQRQVTSGKYFVEQVLGTGPGGKDVLVVAGADGPSPYDRNLYKAPLAGGAMKRISTQPGDHEISLSPTGRYYTVRYSTVTDPPRAAVAAVAGGPAHQYAEADVSRLSTIGYLPPEPFTATAADGKTILHGVVYKPWDFDPSKRYPVINVVYAGPFTAIVPHRFAASIPGSNNAQAMAQMGFITVLVDPRGTTGRSKAFRDVTYGRIGLDEIPDEVAAVRQAAATRPYMDLDRVGIMGHSWGGYFATRGMLTAPDFYKAGYSGAQGMFDQAAMINEPNMGLPDQNPKGYEEGSNVRIAGNLKGAFKMMHGTADNMAPISTTMRMADAFIKAGKQFELLVMPGVQHGPAPPLDRYYFEDQMLFFTRHLGGPR